jgi:hypothetical protein
MNSRISKAKSMKTMRVATVFTGVTACAAVFAPVAHAQVAGTRIHRVRPEISAAPCSGGKATWFHVGYGADQSECYGFAGTTAVGSIYAFCGGNNHGYFSGWTLSILSTNPIRLKHFADEGFGTGSKYYSFTTAAKYGDHTFSMSKLHISGWAGTTRCASYTGTP